MGVFFPDLLFYQHVAGYSFPEEKTIINACQHMLFI